MIQGGGSGSSSPSGSNDPADCDHIYDSDVSFNLEVYEAMYIDDEMCSVNCPCANFVTSSQWTQMNLLEKGRCRSFDFSGTIKTYEECLQQAAAVASPTTKFQQFAKELEAQST